MEVELPGDAVLVVALAIVDHVVRVRGKAGFAEVKDIGETVRIVEARVLKDSFAEHRLDFVVKRVTPLGEPIEPRAIEIGLIRQVFRNEEHARDRPPKLAGKPQ